MIVHNYVLTTFDCNFVFSVSLMTSRRVGSRFRLSMYVTLSWGSVASVI